MIKQSHNVDGVNVPNFKFAIVVDKQFGDAHTSKELLEEGASSYKGAEYAKKYEEQTGVTVGETCWLWLPELGPFLASLTDTIIKDWEKIKRFAGLGTPSPPCKNAVALMLRNTLNASNISTADAVESERNAFAVLNDINQDTFNGSIMELLSIMKDDISEGKSWDDLKKGDSKRRHLYQALDATRVMSTIELYSDDNLRRQKVLALFDYDQENGDSPEFIEARSTAIGEISKLVEREENLRNEPPDDDPDTNNEDDAPSRKGRIKVKDESQVSSAKGKKAVLPLLGLLFSGWLK